MGKYGRNENGSCRIEISGNIFLSPGIAIVRERHSIPEPFELKLVGLQSCFLLPMASTSEEEENAAELKIGEEFLKAKCLMNSEVALILERKYEQLQQMSDDPSTQISQVFEKSLQYVKRFSRYKNPDAVKQVREVLSRNNLAEFELCVIGNLCPETVEEAKAMVPSIKAKGRMNDDEKIEKMLDDLARIKRFE